ncbi:MAG: hypothetical protein KKA73_16550, partial [Chloroflexi bacterium]|nr:hypothetical protein [Chloroflexota bacterium]
MSNGQSRKRGWHFWRNLLLVGLVWGTIMCALGGAIDVDTLTRPARRSVTDITPADRGLDYERVTFAA